MNVRTLVVAALAATFGIGACQPSTNADKALDASTRAYLLSHPDEVREAVQAAADTAARLGQPQLRSALERDPRDFIANPAGKVTVTEFYDFRCGHCANIAPKLVDLIRKRPDVRFVFKDLVIFGPTSARAAMAAIAAKQQGKDVLGLYQDFMSTHPLTDQDVARLAAKRGVSLAAMDNPRFQTAALAQLNDNIGLARQLAIEGTPGFVVGDDLIEGELYDDLLAAIAKAEAKTQPSSQAYIRPAKGDDGSA